MDESPESRLQPEWDLANAVRSLGREAREAVWSEEAPRLETHESVEVLLVEDNLSDEMLALNAFQHQKDMLNHVHVVRDGAQALEYLFCTGAYADRPFENPKLILLDLKLPVVDGIEVLRRIRGDARTRLVPVVVLTSSSDERDTVEAYTLGVNNYIVKPVDFAQLNDLAQRLGFTWLLLNREATSSDDSLADPFSNSQLVSL